MGFNSGFKGLIYTLSFSVQRPFCWLCPVPLFLRGQSFLRQRFYKRNLDVKQGHDVFKFKWF